MDQTYLAQRHTMCAQRMDQTHLAQRPTRCAQRSTWSAQRPTRDYTWIRPILLNVPPCLLNVPPWITHGSDPFCSTFHLVCSTSHPGLHMDQTHSAQRPTMSAQRPTLDYTWIRPILLNVPPCLLNVVKRCLFIVAPITHNVRFTRRITRRCPGRRTPQFVRVRAPLRRFACGSLPRRPPRRRHC
jgi:hypothetical protein